MTKPSQNEGGDKKYTEELSAMGNLAKVLIFDEVKATFAAFYLNCHSVFCFHDPEYVKINFCAKNNFCAIAPEQR